ncbi:2-amino-4-hydroxy-6-hydroxymethyldihydropteridine diphosphokinase [Oxynema aestuarii]|uniref:2-amino-4-hydroxy-6-hydroxymethyldihydropteridine diphosphokinase n=1 Tax=Oxynema aestuarii AP17 TaxID=2064643 RepID=A0A6H1TX23_9CYAN|nr:2-amino-4-hydroxy-6-hydroxymethyldihydropteridine diphosphokinase [Oxynema aestuarii]QIZ71168.1 2-amino-4-hydroxy-6-hydroxymethyldihydropteridine diphosphokinase [Oxynema aestuarii AP17]
MDSDWIDCAIALGSNLGDCRHTLESALKTLAETPGIKEVKPSSWYRTAPVGPPQPDYLNGCATCQVQLEPEALLDRLLAIETQYGRTRGERWGPRTLDLDLLLFGDRISQSDRLQIPHPRLRERAFVLVPLAEIAPDWLDPVSGKAIAELAQALDRGGIEKIKNSVL